MSLLYREEHNSIEQGHTGEILIWGRESENGGVMPTKCHNLMERNTTVLSKVNQSIL
jgi:hypothetical protein